MPVTNLTNNTQWGTWDTPNVPRFYDQTIAATADNRFVMAWQRSIDDGNNRLSTIWYTVRDTSGSVVKPPTQFSGDTCSYGPNLTLLADGSVFLAQSACGWISIGRLDSAGNVLTGLTTFTTDDGNYAPDAVQLPNGNIVLAWRHWSGDKYVIQYAVLNSSLGAVKSAAEELPSLSAVGDDYVSVTFAGDQAVLTWGDACCGYQPNLYYVLLDASGNAVTLPMIFASDYTNYNLRLPYNGQGNTFLPTDTVPPTSQASSPEYALGPFLVTWSGSDADSGIVSYDVQVRDGASGTWTGWLAGTTDTSATYTDGVAGHTYYFRSVAHDAMGNVESDLPADGDAHTTVAAYQLEGQVTNNRAEPVFNATVVAQPAALNIATSAGNGSYTLYLGSAGAYTLTASRYGFGQLPPLYGVEVSTHLSGVDFVLPPLDEGVTNGGWESGNLNGWYSGSGMMPMVEMDAAHTGHYGLQLGTSGGTGSLGFWPFVIQTVSVPGTWSRPTLSFMYRVTQGDVSDKFLLRVSGDSNVITPSVTLIPGEWTHTWYDLSAFSGQTVTLDLGFQDQTGVQQIYLDEISLGKAGAGVFPVYLPLVVRSD